ncbi:MAG: hypothetical protein HQK55_11305 [Deltaproteobacteria bacterium]|nr:hypothetical protein [Deltaproteobacteria bacterium]
MNSSEAGRRSRGEIDEADITGFASLGKVELVSLLHSKTATDRSYAAILLGNFQDSDTVTQLCRQLSIEKKLYTRIAICKSLVKCADLSIPLLIELLGRIGKNQEDKIPETGFYKTSYPLPRDIAARTICRLGNTAIGPLENFIETSADTPAIAQALDAYGHIVYTNQTQRSPASLQRLYINQPTHDFLKYKIARCLSGFHDDWSRSFLFSLLRTGSIGHQLEALRSLLLSGAEIPLDVERSFTGELRKLNIFFKHKLTNRSTRSR